MAWLFRHAIGAETVTVQNLTDALALCFFDLVEVFEQFSRVQMCEPVMAHMFWPHVEISD